MKRRWFLLSIVVLVGLTMAGLSLREALRPTPLNVIFLTVESWRVDAAQPELMPHLFEAARQGAHFTHHRAVSGWTAPNIIALLTGLSPFDQGVHARGHSVSPDHRLLLEELSDEGWRVGGLQAFMTIDVFRNLGLNLTPQDRLLPWLATRVRADEPFVLWHHYLNTQLPYAPSEPFRDAYRRLLPDLDAGARERMATVMSAPVIPAGSVAFEPEDRPAIEALYRGGFAEFDSWFAGFWRFFNASGLRDNTVLVVTADHGEELLDRGEVGHASTTRAGHLSEEVVRIPLFMWIPSHARRGDLPPVVNTVSNHLDIVPELRRLMGRDEAGNASGSLFAEQRELRSQFAATSFGGYAEPDPDNPHGFEASMVDGQWKLRLRQAVGDVVRPYLYDLSADPGERRNLAELDVDRVQNMSSVLLPRITQLWVSSRPTVSTAAMTGEEMPVWVFPQASGAMKYADIGEAARLRWTGRPQGRYVIEYRAGDEPLRLAGEIDVIGPEKDFGVIDESYWRTWIVPYKRVRFRVKPAGRDELASDWIEIEFQP